MVGRTPKLVLFGFVGLLLLLAAGLTFWIVGGGQHRQDLSQLLTENGFVELRPPSTLIKPGAWVQIQARNPLRLRTICSPESALHLTPEQLAQSTSANTSITRAIAGQFNLNASALGLSQAETRGKAVQSVELTLKNIRLIELADDQILKNLAKREKTCADAIKRRYDQDPNSLTMIAAVLIADAEYRLTFSGDIDTNAKMDTVKDLATKANLQIDASRNDSTVLIGTNLVWGVKDDQFMAKQGVALPSTGGAGPKSILRENGPIQEVDLTQQVRRTFDDKFVQVHQDVPVMKQPTTMSCWATVYAMLASWKANKRISIEDAINPLGSPYTVYLKDDRGLPGGGELAFLKVAGLKAQPPANYMLSTYRNLLRERGPLWIIMGNGITSHARLLVGVYGPDEAEKRATYEATIIEFIDPEPGTYTYETAWDFLTMFEREAAYVIDKKLDGLDLRWQILSF